MQVDAEKAANSASAEAIEKNRGMIKKYGASKGEETMSLK
jgi:hypothetical protein